VTDTPDTLKAAKSSADLTAPLIVPFRGMCLESISLSESYDHSRRLVVGLSRESIFAWDRGPCRIISRRNIASAAESVSDRIQTFDEDQRSAEAMASTTEATFDRDAMANWYAQRHLETDTGVEQIHYLPEDAPPREIRFLEVNRLISETTDPEPIDFGVDTGTPNGHSLFVLDVTPSQWEAIQKKKLSLPAGWSLDRRKTFNRGKRP
jgi:hypothetical protein